MPRRKKGTKKKGTKKKVSRKRASRGLWKSAVGFFDMIERSQKGLLVLDSRTDLRGKEVELIYVLDGSGRVGFVLKGADRKEVVAWSTDENELRAYIQTRGAHTNW